MIQKISKSERIDIMLVLALAFERDSGNAPAEQTAAELIKKSFGSISREGREMLRKRAEIFDSLPDKDRKIWQARQLNKIRRRNRANRLSRQIHPEQITAVLQTETRAVRELILRNLPIHLANQIALRLNLPIDFSNPTKSNPPVAEAIVKLIRQQFLAHFVVFEDIYEPTAADNLSVAELARLVRLLGVRETAIACRGISSKESLAAFLTKFKETEVVEIVEQIAEQEKIKPFWVAAADKLVRRNLEDGFRANEFLSNLGLNLLALAYLHKDEAALAYTAQKMSLEDSRKWLEYVKTNEGEFPADEEPPALKKRRQIFERLTEKSVQPNAQ